MGTINFYLRQRIASIILLIKERNFKHQQTFTDSLQQELKEMEISYIFLHSILIPEELIPRKIEKPPGRPKTLPPKKNPKRKSKVIKSPIITPPMSPIYNVTPENSSPRFLSAPVSPNRLSPNISPHFTPRQPPGYNNSDPQSYSAHSIFCETVKTGTERNTG